MEADFNNKNKSNIPVEVKEFIRKCLKVNPNERFALKDIFTDNIILQ